MSVEANQAKQVVIDEIKEKFEKAQLKIGLGVWTTGKNLGGFDVWKEDTVLANSDALEDKLEILFVCVLSKEF